MRWIARILVFLGLALGFKEDIRGDDLEAVLFDVADVPNDCGEFLEFVIALPYNSQIQLPKTFEVFASPDDKVSYEDRDFAIVIKKSGDTTRDYYKGEGDVEAYIDDPKKGPKIYFKKYSGIDKYRYYFLCDKESGYCIRTLAGKKVIAISNKPPTPVNVGNCRAERYDREAYNLICPNASVAVTYDVYNTETKRMEKFSMVVPEYYGVKVGDNPINLELPTSRYGMRQAWVFSGEVRPEEINFKGILELGRHNKQHFFIQVLVWNDFYQDNDFRWLGEQEAASLLAKIKIERDLPPYDHQWSWSLDILGDFDGNKTVDFQDFLIFVELYGTTNPQGDFDESGKVGFSDFLLFTKNFK